MFGTAQHSSHAWSLIHSTGSLVVPSTNTQLAFSPDGTTLAVASPAAQLLGTDAVSLAAAGAQPGAVSLYQVADQGGAPTALLPPLLLEQEQRQQLPELLLWHQWSLASTPVRLAVLPSSGLQLLHGKQLHPSQVCMRTGGHTTPYMLMLLYLETAWQLPPMRPPSNRVRPCVAQQHAVVAAHVRLSFLSTLCLMQADMPTKGTATV